MGYDIPVDLDLKLYQESFFTETNFQFYFRTKKYFSLHYDHGNLNT